MAIRRRSDPSGGGLRVMGALHSLPPQGGGMSSESVFFGPQFWRVHRIREAHRYFLCVERIYGVGLGLGVIHGTLEAPWARMVAGGRTAKCWTPLCPHVAVLPPPLNIFRQM